MQYMIKIAEADEGFLCFQSEQNLSDSYMIIILSSLP